MNIKILTILLILICLLFINAEAQTPFSEFLPNARSMGLGWSSVALPSDPSAGYWNPASLAFLTNDQILININDVSRFDVTGFTRFFPPKIGLGINIFRSMSAQSKYDISSLALGFRINSALAVGSNINLGRRENGEILSSFGFGVFMKSYPDYRREVNSSNVVWKWFRSQDMKDKISLGLTFHNIPIQNIKNGQQLRAGIALKFYTYAPLIHFAYHLSPGNHSLHLGAQMNLMKNIDLYFGMKDFDAKQISVGSSTSLGPFSLALCYLPDTKQYYFSFYLAFSEKSKELVQRYKNKGAQYVKKNDFISGLKEYEKALAYNPEDDKLNFLISILDDRVNDRKEKIDSLYAQAMKFEENGWYVSAFQVYRNILKIDLTNKATRKRLKSISPKLNKYLGELYQQGIAYYNAKEIKQADILFDKILTVNKNHKGAITYTAKIDSINYANFDQYYLRGRGYFKQRNYGRANQEFEKALTINPDHENTLEYTKLIDTLLEKKQQRIKRLLAEAKNYERRKSFIKANYRYKQVLRLDKDNQYAAERVKYLRKIISSIVEDKFRGAKKLFNQKEYLVAIAAFREILSIEPSHQASKRYLKRAQQGLNNFIDEHFRKAQDYFVQNRWNEALEECNIVISLDSKHSAAKSLKADASQHISLNQLNETAGRYYKNKDYLRAKDIYTQIIARIPDDQVANQHLEECEKEINAQIEEKFNQGLGYYSEGDYAEAIEVWGGVLNLDPNHKSTLEYIQKARERLKVLSDIK